MKIKSFLRDKKAIQKDIGQKVIQGGVRGAGACAAAYATNKWLKPDPTKTDKPFLDPKYHGALMFAIGTVGDAVIANEYGQSFSQGVQAYGALHMAGNLFLEKSKADFGLAGVDGSEMGAASTSAPADKPVFNYADLADKRWNEYVAGLAGEGIGEFEIPDPSQVGEIGEAEFEIAGVGDDDLDGCNMF